jgi:hypothetical protein
MPATRQFAGMARSYMALRFIDLSQIRDNMRSTVGRASARLKYAQKAGNPH